MKRSDVIERGSLVRTGVRMACTTEIWERRGEKETQRTPACLACSWIGSDGSSDGTRGQAEEEAGMHERRERHPWQIGLGPPSPQMVPLKCDQLGPTEGRCEQGQSALARQDQH